MATAKGGYYEDMIQQVTGVGLREAVIIKQIMAQDILHSTLDWLSAEEFADVARQAHRIFTANSPFYYLQHKLFETAFKRMKTEQRCERAKVRNKPEELAKEEEKLARYRWQEQSLADFCRRLGA
jgi:hypothetical protein